MQKNDITAFQDPTDLSPKSGIKKLGLVAKYEWLKHFRKKRLYVTVLLSLSVLILLGIVLPYAMVPMISRFTEEFIFPPGEILEFFAGGTFSVFSNIWMVIILLAIFFGVDSISTEFENRTGLLLFPNPLRRETIVLGKYTASILMTIIVFGLFYLVAWLFSIFFYGVLAFTIITQLFWSFGWAILVTAGMLATTYLISVIINKALITSLVVFFLFYIALEMILMIFNMVLSFGGLEFEMWFIISYIADLIPTIMDYPANRITEQTFGAGPMGGTTYTVVPDIITSFWVIIVIYIVIPMVITVFITKRRDVT